MWKLFKMKRLKKPFEVHTEKFLKIWIYYYKTILRHVRLLPEEQYMFVHYRQLVYNDAELFKKLTLDWHFPFIIHLLPAFSKRNCFTGRQISINMFAIRLSSKKQKQ
jgi:hypothetical protein